MPTLYFAEASSSRPHVTLTFAQSLDAKIAGPGKAQLALSCKESMLMTHHLRTMHDGIMVGIGTVLNDDPQLNARLLPQPPSVADLPRPIVLDTELRTPLTCKLLRNYANGTGRQPLLLCSVRAASEKRAALEKAGAHVVQMDHSGSALEWTTVLAQLRLAGVHRLMIEGGATVIASLLDQQHLIDTLLVTIAPITVGPDGLGYPASLPDHRIASDWISMEEKLFGSDNVFVWQKNSDALFNKEI